MVKEVKKLSFFPFIFDFFYILKDLGIEYFKGYYFCKPERLENVKK
jgi:hypothetical protein